jgi:hypothetical protein
LLGLQNELLIIDVSFILISSVRLFLLVVTLLGHESDIEDYIRRLLVKYVGWNIDLISISLLFLNYFARLMCVLGRVDIFTVNEVKVDETLSLTILF